MPRYAADTIVIPAIMDEGAAALLAWGFPQPEMGFEEITGDVREPDFWTVSQYLFGHATDTRLTGRPAVPLPVAPRLEGRLVRSCFSPDFQV